MSYMHDFDDNVVEDAVMDVERSTNGKTERRRASRKAIKAARRARRKTAQHEPSSSTHRLVGTSSKTDDLAWDRHRRRGFRAMFVTRRDEIVMALALA